MPSYILIASFSLVVLAIYVVLQKVVLKYIKIDHTVFIFYFFLINVVVLLPLVFSSGGFLPAKEAIWPTLTAGVFRGIFMVVYFYTVEKLDVTTLAPLFNLRVIFSALLEFLIIGTIFTTSDYAWMIVLIAGGLLLTMDDNWNWKSFFSKPVLIAVGNIFLLAIVSILINISLVTSNFWTFNLWFNLISALTLMPLIVFKKKKLLLSKKVVKWLLVLATLAIVGTTLEYWSIGLSVTGTAIILSIPLSTVAVTIFSAFKPGLIEKNSWRVYAVRLVAAIIMTVAAWQFVS